MPKTKKNKSNQNTTEIRDSRPLLTEKKNRRTGIIIISLIVTLFVVIIGGIVWVPYYQTNIAPFRTTVLSVDGTSIRMDYFLKRAKLAGASPMGLLGNLADEHLIRQGAARYGIKVTPDEANNALRDAANGASDNASQSMTDTEFREWYRQTLRSSGLTDGEYKDMVTLGLLGARLQTYLAERVPNTAPQSHVHVIFVRNPEDAQKVLTRLQADEDFATVAKEVSLDGSRDNGGDVGWVPQGVLVGGLDYLAFNLKVGEISSPLPIQSDDPDNQAPEGYYIVMVSEKSDSRLLDDNAFQMMKDLALQNWLSVERSSGTHQIKYIGLNGQGFDAETNAWINWQLSKK